MSRCTGGYGICGRTTTCCKRTWRRIYSVPYSHYELGKRDIPTDVLIRLAFFYKTSVDYLLGITDVAEPYPRKG